MDEFLRNTPVQYLLAAMWILGIIICYTVIPIAKDRDADFPTSSKAGGVGGYDGDHHIAFILWPIALLLLVIMLFTGNSGNDRPEVPRN